MAQGTITALVQKLEVRHSFPGKGWRPLSEQVEAGNSVDLHTKGFCTKVARNHGQSNFSHGAIHPRGVELCVGEGEVEHPVGDGASAVTRCQQ